MVAGLRNVDEGLARTVATGLGLDPLPEPLEPARPPVDDLAPSPALSIVLNGPTSFAGRKVGALVTEGTDLDLLGALRSALEAEGALLELVAPTVGGIAGHDGDRIPADQSVAGGPSVLYDAVALLPSREGAAQLAADPAARDFVTDAVAHQKYVGHVDGAAPLLGAAGVAGSVDEGFVPLSDAGSVDVFLQACRRLRHWERAAPAPVRA
jgi:catalase